MRLIKYICLVASFISVNMSNTFAQDVIFHDDPLRARVEGIRTALLAKQNANEQIINSQSIQADSSGLVQRAIDEENYRKNNTTCFQGMVTNKLNSVIEKTCRVFETDQMCQNFADQSRTRFDLEMKRMTASFLRTEQSGMVSMLRQVKVSLETTLSDIMKFNDACSDAVSRSLFSNECIKTYDAALDDHLTTLVTNNCTQDAIDNAVTDFREFMNGHYTRRISSIRKRHTDSRELEGKLAEKIAETRNQINKLEEQELLNQPKTASVGK